jgi:hypothetical protein
MKTSLIGREIPEPFRRLGNRIPRAGTLAEKALLCPLLETINA